jgi:hypothetical protein
MTVRWQGGPDEKIGCGHVDYILINLPASAHLIVVLMLLYMPCKYEEQDMLTST